MCDCINLLIFHEFLYHLAFSFFLAVAFIITAHTFDITTEDITSLLCSLFSSLLPFSLIAFTGIVICIDCDIYRSCSCKLNCECYYHVMLMGPCNISANNDETRFSGDHNSLRDGKTVLLSVFSNSRIVLSTINHPRGRCVAVNFQYQETFSIRTATFFPFDLVRKSRSKREKDRRRTCERSFVR